MNREKCKQYFINSNNYDSSSKNRIMGPNGWLLFVACNAGIDFAKKVAHKYQDFLEDSDECCKTIPIIGTDDNKVTTVFSDTETCPRLNRNVAGSHAFVFQSVHENLSQNTVNENIQQLLQVVRTLRAHRASVITVVLPYSPYSRQDKPTFMQRESALANLFADQLKIAGADVCLTYHAHTLALYGFYEPEISLVALSGLDLFKEVFQEYKGKSNVIAVSTDAGGAKFLAKFADSLDLSYAISSKIRSENSQISLMGIIGDLRGKDTAIVVDDETVTGGSLINVIKFLNQQYRIKNIHAALSHFKVKEENLDLFIDAHKNYGLKKLHITNSIPQISELSQLDFVHCHQIEGIVASTINCLHYNRSVSQVFSRS